MKLPLTIIKIIIISLFSLSTFADDFMVEIKLPAKASNQTKQELDNLIENLKTNVLEVMIANGNVTNQLIIKCSMAPYITNVEHYIQKHDYSQLAMHNNKSLSIPDNTEMVSFSDFEHSGSLNGCKIEHFPKIVSEKINNYLSSLVSSNQNTDSNHEASVFYVETKPKEYNKTVYIKYFSKKLNIGIN